MKTSNINGRCHGSIKHNDRSFDLDKAPHIDQSKVCENKYYTYNGETEMTFRELELEYYQNHFEQSLEDYNERHTRNRHRERVKTIEQLYAGKWTHPEDKILQIGDINEHTSTEELWECALEYKDRFEDIYGDNCIILDMALHVDEATPHVHVRRVWFVEDEKTGHEMIGQNKALTELGIAPPRPDKPVGRYNNPKMTLTQMDTELFKRICFEHGLDIDMESPGERQEHLMSAEYKSRKYQEERGSIEKIFKELAKVFCSIPYLRDKYEQSWNDFHTKSMKGKAMALRDVARNAVNLLSDTLKFIKAKELDKEFISWRSKNRKRQHSEIER